MFAKKADHSVVRLLQISQQHIVSQFVRVKHERKFWWEVVERRQQQPYIQRGSVEQYAKGYQKKCTGGKLG